jgi:hypothetical protein
MIDPAYEHMVDLARAKAKATGKSQEVFKLSSGGYAFQECGQPWPKNAAISAVKLIPATMSGA